MTLISATVTEDRKLFLWQIQPYICLHVRGDYSQFKLKALKSCYVGDYNKNINSGYEGCYKIRNYVGVGFLIEHLLESSLNCKTLPLFKRGALKTTHKFWNRYFVILWKGLHKNLRPRCHNCAPSTWIYTPPTHVQLEIRMVDVLGYVVFECHANFQSNWELFACKDQENNMFRIRYP